MAAHRQYNSYKSHYRAQKGADHYHPVLGVGRRAGPLVPLGGAAPAASWAGGALSRLRCGADRAIGHRSRLVMVRVGLSFRGVCSLVCDLGTSPTAPMLPLFREPIDAPDPLFFLDTDMWDL